MTLIEGGDTWQIDEQARAPTCPMPAAVRRPEPEHKADGGGRNAPTPASPATPSASSRPQGTDQGPPGTGPNSETSSQPSADPRRQPANNGNCAATQGTPVG